MKGGVGMYTRASEGGTRYTYTGLGEGGEGIQGWAKGGEKVNRVG